MTLLITIVAASISTLIWYTNEKARTLKIGTLTLAYWGASLMWLVDAVAEYIELREKFFIPSVSNMINDIFLGFSVVVLGFVVWVLSTLIKDNNTIKKILLKR